jgi:transposase
MKIVEHVAYVGLDYHSGGIQLCMVDAAGRVLSNRRVENDWRAVKRTAEALGVVKAAAIESCSGAANLAEELVTQAGWSVDLAHPGYVSRMRQHPDKTDFSDARMLADLCRVGYLPKVWLAPALVRQWRVLVRHRQRLVDERRAIKLQAGALVRDARLSFTPHASSGADEERRWSKPWLAWLASTDELDESRRYVIDSQLRRLRFVVEEIAHVEQMLRRAMNDDPLVKRLLELPGVGEVTAWTLRAEIGRFDRFRSGKQLSRFCGLSPRNVSSGERQADAGLIKAGNNALRAVIIQAAHRLARHDPRWSALARQWRARGKPGSLVAAGIGNRWMRWLFHQMKETPME